MKSQLPFTDEARLIRFASLMWLGYLALMLVIGLFDPPRRGDALYYILNGAVALACLGLSYWGWLQHKLNKFFIPAIVAVITIMPVLNNWIAMRLAAPGPRMPPEGPILGILPFMLVALLLVAWKYRWQYVLLLILGFTGLNLFMVWTFMPPGSGPFPGALNTTLIQAVVFLAVGFSISFLMGRLKEQQRSLEQANKNLTHYASTLDQLATTRERNRLARELHDTLAHTMSGLSVQLEAVDAYWNVDREAVRSMLDQSLVVARNGLEETRRALRALRASPLDDLGLALALKSLVKEASTNTGITVKLNVPDEIASLAPDVEQCIYRVAQEAVLNAVRHSGAKTLVFGLEQGQGKLRLTVQDDGIGFDADNIGDSRGYGLIGMKERAQLAGAELNISSGAKMGTTITLTV